MIENKGCVKLLLAASLFSFTGCPWPRGMGAYPVSFDATVLDAQTQKPISDATVLIAQGLSKEEEPTPGLISGEDAVQLKTDPQGRFKWEGRVSDQSVYRGRVRVQIQKDGYKTLCLRVGESNPAWTRGSDAQENFRMQPEDGKEKK